MSLLQRIAREPNALTGLVIAIYSALVVFGVFTPTATQTGALGMVGGALVILLRWLVTPSSEVVVQQRTDDTEPIAGAALGGYEAGTPIDVSVSPIYADGDDVRDPGRP